MAYSPEVLILARRLRSEGASILDIARKLDVAKASISVWVRDIPLTQEQRSRLDDRARNDKHYLKAAAARSERSKARRVVWCTEANKLWAAWSNDPLFMLGIGIYWGEGTKGMFSVSNSDPDLLRAWLRWCRKFVPKHTLRMSLQVHPGAEVEKAKDFWEEALGLQVNSVSTAPERPGRVVRKTIPNGVLQIAIGKGNTEWLVKMRRWLDLA